MIHLSDEDDPMLFSMTLPQGQLVVQYMEVVAMLQARLNQNSEPTPADVVAAIRDTARTKDVAKEAPDYVLVAAWTRMTTRVQAVGNA